MATVKFDTRTFAMVKVDGEGINTEFPLASWEKTISLSDLAEVVRVQLYSNGYKFSMLPKQLKISVGSKKFLCAVTQ